MNETDWTNNFTADKLAALEYDEAGLIPVVIQDADTGRILTLAYANQEALTKMVESRETWLFSRSRQALWHKGETSGHTQAVVGLYEDCDGDALVALVRPSGPACHTGAMSCFAGTPDVLSQTAILHDLELRIADREIKRPEGAYTTYLFAKGIDKILKKVGEETAEVIIAAKNRDPDELRYESADLLYHLLVLLREQGLPLADVLHELQSRYSAGTGQ